MARTRDQIAEAALSAFSDQGYDATTLDQIADTAEVHKRTLLRYFPTKAHLVLHNYYEAFDAFREELLARQGVSVIDAWEGHVVSHAREIDRRASLSRVRRLIAVEPSIRQAFLEIQAAYLDLLAIELSREAKTDFAADIRSKVVAAALVGGNFAVGGMVLQREAYGEMESAEREVIRLVRAGFPVA
jgi:AcrR family transcriptional regulator